MFKKCFALESTIIHSIDINSFLPIFRNNKKKKKKKKKRNRVKPHRFAPFSAGALRRWRAPCAGTLASRARGTRSAAGWRPAFRSHSAALQSVPVKQKKKVTKHSWIDTKISSLTMIPSWIELKKKNLGLKLTKIEQIANQFGLNHQLDLIWPS